jgi:protein-L-isoaspartate(D-aspartate) O-methyltransferase
MFGEQPMPDVYWEDVLECESMGLGEGSGASAHDELIAAGWVVESKDEDGDVQVSLAPGMAERVGEVFAEFEDQPLGELSDFEVCVLAEAVRLDGWLLNGASLLEGYVFENNGDHKTSQELQDETLKVSDALRDQKLLLEYQKGDEWLLTGSPWAWCHREEIFRREVEAQPALRGLLLNYLQGDLGVEEDSLVFRALETIDRADFVPLEEKFRAYRNLPAGILKGMTTSQPFVLGHILKALDLKEGDNVLLCGTKSGILATLAAHIVGPKGRVHCIDDREDVVEYARSTTKKYPELSGRIQVNHRPDVTVGDDEYGPWEVVIVNGSLPKIPRDILTQMSDGGRLLFFLHSPEQDGQVCYLVRKNEDVLDQKELSTFVFTPIYGQHGWEKPSDLDDAYKRAKSARARGGPAQIIDHELPYPLANAYSVAINAGDPAERHTRTLKAYESLIKYFTFPLVSHWQAQAESASAFPRHLHTLATRPSLGNWLAAARDLSKQKDLGGVAGNIHKVLHGVNPHPRVQACVKMIKERIPSLKINEHKATLLDFLGAIVSYRNRSGEGHGAVRGGRGLEESVNILLEAFGVLLTETPWLMNHQLLCLQEYSQGKNGLRMRALDFQGASRPRLASDAESQSWLQEDRDVLSLFRGLVVIKDGSGQFLPVEPWIVWGAGTAGEHEDLFFFNARTNAGEPEYLTTHDPNNYHTTEERKRFQALLEEFPEEREDPVLDLFKGMLDTFLRDGMIDKKEMADLCHNLVKSGLYSNEVDAERYVREVAEDRNPGVVFED